MDEPLTPLPTERLQARNWTADDLPLAQQLWGDPQVVRYLDGNSSTERAEARLRQHLGFAAQSGLQYWPWFTQAGGELVGVCGLRPPQAPGEHQLGFHLRPAYWGQGYGAEMARAVIAHAFGPRGAAVLWAGRHPHNAASERLLLKLGFQFRHDELLERTGLFHPWYSLARSAVAADP